MPVRHHLQHVIESAIDFAIIGTDLNGVVTDWNAGAENIFGWRCDEIVGASAERLFTTADRAEGRPNEEMRLAVVDGRASDERWHLRKDGTQFWASGELMPLRIEDGTHQGYVKIVRDRTRQHEAGKRLRETRDRFETLLQTVETAFAIVEVKFDGEDRPVDYRFLEANPAFERQAGVNLRGKWVTEFAPNLERFWFETYGRVAWTGEPATFESYAEAFGRWFDVRAIRVGEPAERQIAIFFNDTTERRVAEERLRASEALARENVQRVQLALAAGAIIGTWHWDLTTDRFTVDEGFARSFGLDPALGREGIPLAQIVATVHADDQTGLAAAIDEAIKRGGAYAHQYRVRRTDGRYYWIEANGRVDNDADGTPSSFPGVLIDVEERRTVAAERDRATAELRTLNETLEQRVADRTAELMRTEEQLRQSQKMEAVGQLTGGVAHDFNNLLTVIKSSTDLLKRPNLAEERRTRYIAAISDTVDRAAKLTSQLLAFARRQALRPTVFDAGQSVRMLSEMVSTLTGARIRVATHLDEEACFVNADPSQFDTALVNMAVNARDAMDGAGEITIRVKAVEEIPAVRTHPIVVTPTVAVSISDTGIGIAPADLERIFEPFFTTKDVGQGTGLGLSQVFGFAKQSGGEVIVESVVEQGTTFTLYLPRVPAPVEVAIEHDDEATADGGNLCVLVVEDNREVGNFVTQTLEELGYRTNWVENGQAALLALAEEPDAHEIVFSDVVMPGMTGIELGREIRRLYPGLPVILTSGYSHVLAQEGGHGFELLQKPYSVEALSRALSKAASKRRRRRSTKAR
ncbi:PAS domain S-box protein [Methylobacterium sp. J-001]|uniref:PAS domain S-box protein n=1 Tax=Methylobacterium sp. J-001 TaxID=2836609 RepID=UPI001FB9D661|nr:PAS domain S-box protein [Methylobacterium sp. J-001]MCJ2120075.1 PAS domain S-box protein [Methylobacterium sp. J-001]